MTFALTLYNLIFQLKPAVDKMQKDVDAIAKRQATDGKVLESVASRQADTGKAVDKMASTVEETQERLLEVKDYSKDTLDELEHILEKVGKVQKITAEQSTGGGDHGKLTKEIRDFKDRSMSYLQEIQKNTGMGPRGMGFSPRGGGGDPREPRMNPNHRGFGHRGGYGQRGGNHLGHGRDPSRGGAGVAGGMRRPSSPEEYRRSRSESNRSKTRSRSRSRSRSATKRSRSGSSSGSEEGGKSAPKPSKKSKDNEDDDDDSSEEGDIELMEFQLEKISNGVVEITEKMDSWLRYSKKTLKKSDDNTENVFGKIEATNDCIASLKNELKAEMEGLAAKVASVAAAAAAAESNKRPTEGEGGGAGHGGKVCKCESRNLGWKTLIDGPMNL